jgi:ferredoxin-nitrate reductase
MLLKYKELEFVEINQEDAVALQLNEGEIVKVVSIRGELKAKVVFADINAKTIFIPISHRNINYLTDDKLDPHSKEPDYNHSAVRIEKIEDITM